MSESQQATKEDLSELRRRIKHDMESYLGTLYEKFADDQKLLTEGLAETNQRLDSIEKKTDTIPRIEEKLDAVVEAVQKSQADLKDTKKRVDLLEQAATG